MPGRSFHLVHTVSCGELGDAISILLGEELRLREANDIGHWLQNLCPREACLS
jgi:hypothetical protein